MYTYSTLRINSASANVLHLEESVLLTKVESSIKNVQRWGSAIPVAERTDAATVWDVGNTRPVPTFAIETVQLYNGVTMSPIYLPWLAKEAVPTPRFNLMGSNPNYSASNFLGKLIPPFPIPWIEFANTPLRAISRIMEQLNFVYDVRRNVNPLIIPAKFVGALAIICTSLSMAKDWVV
ncbi:hypothetical protein EGR_10648 [Echinococcus granulosus]|uniref:Uncharacterized protein n=1 Tax=Echinococcus granulosus TaxID=6210 RepID=W6U7Y2_ECHGR|nr:hypothetical protein EGR_10648 [Echinococcus granulosus]EUB54497.1 hypothetical protein EGR_10648 [Echinococcus granulosus]